MGNRVSERVQARIRIDFEPGSVQRVLSRLAGLQLSFIDSDEGRERVHAAVVLLADGGWSAFERQAALAESDWRDVLVAAGLAEKDWQERLNAQLGIEHEPNGS